MADQEFLASFAVDIDETGVTRLQAVLKENRDLADEVADAFSAATKAIQEYVKELSEGPGLPSGTGHGITTENAFGSSGPSLGLDTSRAKKDLEDFIALAKKPVPLSANASGITSAARTAWSNVKSLFSDPLTIQVKTETGDGKNGGKGSPTAKMSSGGRFTRPTDVQVAEDGDAEYIIPVKKEDRAVPLLRRLLSELSPAARESLAGDAGSLSLPAGMAAGSAFAGTVTQNNQNVSAPVSIEMYASGTNAEQIGQSVYDTAERYLLRTLKSVTA